MDNFPMAFQTLSPEERDAIPPNILQKIQLSFNNQQNLFQATINSLYKKNNEVEFSLSMSHGQLDDKIKKIQNLEKEKNLLAFENNVKEKKIESLKNEIVFLSQLIKNKAKTNKETIREEYESKRKEFDKLLGGGSCGDLNRLKKANKVLETKVVDLKRQLSYLLDTSVGEKDEQKQNLIKIIQTISRENDRLNELQSKETDVEGLKTQLIEREKTIKDLRLAVNQNNLKVSEEYQKLFDEYQKISEEKNNLYEQIVAFYNNKLALEENIKLLESENNKINIQIEYLKTNQDSYEALTNKYNETNSELIKSNTLLREYKQRVFEVTKKLEESEQRYSKYILSNRSDIVAILGREFEYLKDKIGNFVEDYADLTDFYTVCKSEEDKLKQMYRTRCSELEDHRLKITKYENQQVILNDVINVIPKEMRDTLNELLEGLESSFRDFYSLFETSKTISTASQNLIYLLQNDNHQKESIIKSLVSGDKIVFESLLKKENTNLKNEINLLSARIENLQREDYNILTDKLDKIKLENDNLREYITNLSSEVLEKEHVIRNLEDNLRESTEALEAKKLVIEKYAKVVEKLRTIKNEYLKLKAKMKETKPPTENLIEGSSTNGQQEAPKLSTEDYSTAHGKRK